MACMCPWLCVSDTISSALVQAHEIRAKSFIAALAGPNVNEERPLPIPCMKGDSLSIKIFQDEYQRGVEECKNVL